MNKTARTICIRQIKGNVTQKAVLLCERWIESRVSGDGRDIGDRR